MAETLKELISENKSPLFRIMSAYDLGSPTRRRFENNISAFHVGDGYFLSVAHTLLFHNNIVRSLSEELFGGEFLTGVAPHDQSFINAVYSIDPSTGKRHWNENPATGPQLTNLLANHRTDYRYPELYKRGICSPYLIVQFNEDKFFSSEAISTVFDSSTHFYEENIEKFTFLLPLELVEIFEKSDIALYRLRKDVAAISNDIPSIEIDFGECSIGDDSLYCLQGAPINEVGRMLNRAQVDGVIDHFSPQAFLRGRHLSFSGPRYLIKGFFRFGSSGAPYVRFDKERGHYLAVAIQSEACPLTLQIGGNREGHAQFVSAIASPLFNVREALNKYRGAH